MTLSNKTKLLIKKFNLPSSSQLLEKSLKSEHINRTAKYIDSIILNQFPDLRNNSNYKKKLLDFSESIFDLFFLYTICHYRLKSIRSFFTLCKSTGRKLDLDKINLIEIELRAIYTRSRTNKNRTNLDEFVEHKKIYLDDVIEKKKRENLSLKINKSHDTSTPTPDLKLSDSEIKSIEKDALSEFNAHIKNAESREIGRPILESSKLIDNICSYFHKIFGFELKEHIQDKNVYKEIRYSGKGLDFIYQLLKLNIFINSTTLIDHENNYSVFDIIFKYDFEVHNEEFLSDSREVAFDTKIQKYIGEYVYTH